MLAILTMILAAFGGFWPWAAAFILTGDRSHTRESRPGRRGPPPVHNMGDEFWADFDRAGRELPIKIRAETEHDS